MPRKPAANAEIRKARRKEILRAAARVFAERGLREAKVSDIARAAGLSHGLIYHYFDSKDALAEAIFDEKLNQMSNILASGLGEGSVIERLARGCELFVEQTSAEPEVALFVTQAVVNRALPDSLRERLTGSAQAAFEQLTTLITEGQKTGEVDDNVPAGALATAVAALVRGLSLFHEVKVGPTPVAPPVDVIARLLCPRSCAAGTESDPSKTQAPRKRAAPKARTAGRRRRNSESS